MWPRYALDAGRTCRWGADRVRYYLSTGAIGIAVAIIQRWWGTVSCTFGLGEVYGIDAFLLHLVFTRHLIICLISKPTLLESTIMLSANHIALPQVFTQVELRACSCDLITEAPLGTHRHWQPCSICINKPVLAKIGPDIPCGLKDITYPRAGKWFPSLSSRNDVYWLAFSPSGVVALHVFQSVSVQEQTLGYLARSSGGGGFLFKRGPVISMGKGRSTMPMGPSAPDVISKLALLLSWAPSSASLSQALHSNNRLAQCCTDTPVNPVEYILYY